MVLTAMLWANGAMLQSMSFALSPLSPMGPVKPETRNHKPYTLHPKA